MPKNKDFRHSSCDSRLIKILILSIGPIKNDTVVTGIPIDGEPGVITIALYWHSVFFCIATAASPISKLSFA